MNKKRGERERERERERAKKSFQIGIDWVAIKGRERENTKNKARQN